MQTVREWIVDCVAHVPREFEKDIQAFYDIPSILCVLYCEKGRAENEKRLGVE